MPVLITKLSEQIDSNLAAGGLTSVACCQLTNAKTILNNSKVFSVQSLSDLSLPSENIGRLIYIRNIGEYRFSDGCEWRKNLSTCPTVFYKELWTWGSNNCGALGIGNSVTLGRCSPVREFCSSTDWNKITQGVSSNHIHAIKNNGELWSWGNNASGQLAIGTATPSSSCSPIREFCSASDWCMVSSSDSSSSAIKTNGQLWSWGINTNGRLGDGTITTRCSPVREFCSATDWYKVSIGTCSVSALKTTGEIWSWGTNNFGQLGIGSSATIGRCSAVREFCSATNWCQVSVGYRHVSALKNNGEIWSWGTNLDGVLGIGNSATIGRCSPVREFCSATDWCQVNAGGNFTAALKTSGQLWTWGVNANGRLGIGSSATLGRCSPVREFCSATDWCYISASSFSVMGLKTNGEMWGWGCLVGSSSLSCSAVREFCKSTEWACVSHLCVSGLAIKYIKGGFLL